MNKHSHNHSERGDITVIIAIAAVLLIIGALVWMVWLRPSGAGSGSQSSQSSSTSSNSSTSNSNSSTGGSAEQQGLTYVAVSQWGVKIPIISGMGSFEFSINNEGVLLARSKELNELSGTCTDNSVAVVRGKADDRVIGEMGLTDTTFKQAYDAADATNVTVRSIKAHVGDYYYVVPGFSSASCVGASVSDQQKETDAMLAIVKAINQMVAQ